MFETDPFVETERDPKKCDALKSSLWEMATLRDAHYFHQIGKLVKTISDKDLSDRVKTAELPVNELCSANYASLLSEELGARVKSAPTSFHQSGVNGLFRTPLMKRCFPEDRFSWGETTTGQEES
jgi:U3 small nucleolar RNA-associated protein 19